VVFTHAEGGGPRTLTAIVQDVTARKQAEDDFRRQAEVSQTLVDEIPVMVVIAGPDGRIEWVNREWERILGWSLEEARTRDILADAYPDPAYREEVVDYIKNPPFGWRDFRTRIKDGQVRDTSWANVLLSDRRSLGIGSDVTERKRRDAERETSAARLRGLADTALAIGAAGSLDEITHVVTEGARRIIGAHQAVTSFTVDENWGQAIHGISLSEKYAAYSGYDVKPDGSGIYRLVCQTNRPIRMTQRELEAHAAWRGFGTEAGRHPPMRGWLAVPLVARDGRNLGLIQLSDRNEGEFDEADEAILVQLAQLASQAVENARLLQEVTGAHQRLRTLSRRLVTLQEEERRTIARELHDEVGQLLTSLNFLVEARERGGASVAREQVRDMTSQLLDRIRDLSLNLRPPMLDDLGLVPTLLWHVERYRAQTGIEVRFRHRGMNERLPVGAEITAFRIVQEALTNVARHAGVTEACVDFWMEDGGLWLRVEDGGRGFDPSALRGASSGLTGMRERALLLGGALTVDSAPGRGTRVIAGLPLVSARSQATGDDGTDKDRAG
jgi:PAS domain S-box-containing protein